MKSLPFRIHFVIVFILVGVLATSPLLAEKPTWAGNKKNGKNENTEMRQSENGKANPGPGGQYESDGHDGSAHFFFNEQHSALIQDYYDSHYSKGKCPPGLAKKNNGCMPPGQAKKWAIGRQLPRDVIFYDLPPRLLEQLGPPPSHHRFVRVAQDILLITIGVGMVVDAIEDLNWEFDH